jgi:hypothetical protein
VQVAIKTIEEKKAKMCTSSLECNPPKKTKKNNVVLQVSSATFKNIKKWM